MEIVTLAFNRPDFIELQLNSLKKWVKDFNYTVYDNCPDNSVKLECERLGIKCIPIKLFSADPSWVCGISLNKMWEILQYEFGTLVYIDPDMFLVGELPDMGDVDFAFVPQVKGQYTYPWTGFMMFNMETLPHPEALKWHVDYSLKDTDVGGLNHFYLQEYKPKVQELEMWTLTREGCSFNGVETICKPEHTEIEKIDLPRPFDILKCKGKDFILHYKSASNYPDFYTPEYNRLKTIALKKLL
jgi:hypothetical protein